MLISIKYDNKLTTLTFMAFSHNFLFNHVHLSEGKHLFYGEWKNDRPHGGMKPLPQADQPDQRYGSNTKLFSNSGDNFYQGIWEEGQMNGAGRLIIDTGGGVLDGEFFKGDITRPGRLYIPRKYMQYSGDYANGGLTGKGKIFLFKSHETFLGDETYYGDVVKGQMHGKGLYTFLSRATYEGDFRENTMHGKGTIAFTEVDIYQVVVESNKVLWSIDKAPMLKRLTSTAGESERGSNTTRSGARSTASSPKLASSANFDELWKKQGTKLRISAQNCNSLNMSDTKTGREIRGDKLNYILTGAPESPDIIFLSDIRLNDRKLTVPGNNRSYRLLPNSTQSSRGVAILIAEDILQPDCEIAPLCISSNPENILAIDITFHGVALRLVSIYAPNEGSKNQNQTTQQFYDYLKETLIKGGDQTLPLMIIGGDWNTTPCQADPKVNPDLFNSKSAPNRTGGRMLADLCHHFKLYDVWRLTHPFKRQVTYRQFPNPSTVPSSSRLDFFLISEPLLPFVLQAGIYPEGLEEMPTALLDHKTITLSLIGKDRSSRSPLKVDIAGQNADDGVSKEMAQAATDVNKRLGELKSRLQVLEASIQAQPILKTAIFGSPTLV